MRRDIVETDEIPLLLVRLIYCESGIGTFVVNHSVGSDVQVRLIYCESGIETYSEPKFPLTK